jgi:outer membrane protein assembly factor BamB
MRLHQAVAWAVLAVVLTAGAARAEHVVGWRGDRTGAFADAAPVTDWSETEHVLWKTPLPSWSNASPAVVKGRVFVLSEPNHLLCLDEKTGKLLWQRENDHLDLILPRDEAARVRRLWEEEWEFERARNVFLWEEQTLLEKLRAAPGDPNLLARQADLRRRMHAAGLDFSRKGEGVSDEEARVRGHRREMLRQKYGLYFTTWEHWDMWIGYTMATPVSDGECVYVSLGQNVVACYDLDGHRRWMKWFKEVPRPRKWKGIDGDLYWNGYPRALFVASPLLVGDTLVVQGGREIRGMDRHTGAVRWSRLILGYIEYAVGSPVHVTLPDRDVVVTAWGDALRLGDGTLLATGVGYAPNGASPVAVGDTVYFINGANPGGRVPGVRNTIEAVRLKPAGHDRVTLEAVWKKPFANKTSVSPVVHDGLLYHIRGNALVVRDARTGELLGPGVRVEHDYPSPCLAGRYVVVSDSAGHFTVVRAGRNLEMVARNVLETDPLRGAKLEQRRQLSGKLAWRFMLATPFFDGGRMFVRSYDNLYCIGAPGAAGRQGGDE